MSLSQQTLPQLGDVSSSSGNDNNDREEFAGVSISVSSSSSRPTAFIDEDDDDDDPTNSINTTREADDSRTMSLLSTRQAVALLIADCLGTGLLALPQTVWILGRTLGLGFLIGNLPMNWYAGTLLSRAAYQVEQQQQPEQLVEHEQPHEDDVIVSGKSSSTLTTQQHNDRTNDGIMRIRNNKMAGYSSIRQPTQHAHHAEERVEGDLERETDTDDFVFVEHCGMNQHTRKPPVERGNSANHTTAYSSPNDNGDYANNNHNADDSLKSNCDDDDSPTRDLIGLTRVLFPHPRATQYQPRATHLVMGFFYTNIFLVLGDYILVMSHAVVALLNDQICLPWAGVLASTLMFALCQLRTMAHLGHTVTALSLTTLAIVVLQCLVADQKQEHNDGTATAAATAVPVQHGPAPMLRQLSALASIAFATGPNKLVLNIRNEMNNRQECPQMLGVAVTVYGVVYVVIVLLAGPSESFDEFGVACF